MNPVILPEHRKNLLLHCCCAPCGGGIIIRLLESNVNFKVFFYNPNIFPEKEYIKRKQTLLNFLKKYKVSFIDLDENYSIFKQHTENYKNELEQGIRCKLCFELRLKKTAETAKELKCTLIATTLGISRYKNIIQVTQAGFESVKKIKTVDYFDFNWRKKGGSQFMSEISKKENFYSQKYCGCEYSMNSIP